MTYFWADTHFNHQGILHHTSRPWKTVAAMNAELIERWNFIVENESDEIWLLGDFGFHAPTKEGTTDLLELFWKLRGRKCLVVGNHDAKNSQVLRLPWERIEKLVELKVEGSRFVLCHYPLESWPGMHRGAIHLHGHCHGTLRRKAPKRFDVGADCYTHPVPWDMIVEKANAQTFEASDHHGSDL